jgi:hypothetical protein
MSPVADPTDPPASVRAGSRTGDSTAALTEHGPCPDCGAPMAADQRYCLACGHRRGEPRLPFMDASAFMNRPDVAGAGRIPPPPPPRPSDSPRRWNQNAVLVIGVAALLLAIGIGFLIGRSLNQGTPGHVVTEKITIEPGTEGPDTSPEGHSGGNGPEGKVEPNGSNGHESAQGTAPDQKPSANDKPSKAEVEAETKLEEELKKQLHPTVELPNPKAQAGEPCKAGTTGCGKSGKFGEFFGVE